MSDIIHYRLSVGDGVSYGQGYVLPDDAEAMDPQDWAEAAEAARQPPEPPPPRRLAKAELWRRLSDEEAETLDAALAAAPIRLRRIYEAASYLDTADADYPVLRAGIVGALGEERADEVLTPDH